MLLLESSEHTFNSKIGKFNQIEFKKKKRSLYMLAKIEEVKKLHQHSMTIRSKFLVQKNPKAYHFCS